ncbi:uncharacterized protein LOC118264506 isoform X3 [Spodoptera frugiperda]|nr:uncharacterized protein LOC118264506 isoform X3 [Spodoptera frugiperda]
MASVASSTSKTPSRMHCNDWEKFMKKASNYVCTMSALNGNYVAVIAIIVVVILSLLLPDITQKFHATHELKNMKKVLAKMSNEVRRAEVACLTVADEICCLHCNMHDDTTGTVSISQLKNYKTSQSVPTIACELLNRNLSQSKKKLVSFGAFSSPIPTHPTRKSPSCHMCTPIPSTLNNKMKRRK